MPPPDDEAPPPNDQGVIDLDPDGEPEAEPDPCLEAVVKHLPRSQSPSGFEFGAGLLLRFLYWPTIREHLHIKPKGQRGAPRKPSIDEAWNLWMQGYRHAEYCHKLRIPKEKQSGLTSAIRQRMHNLNEDERRAVTEARDQAQQARRTQSKSVIKPR
ncbi:MAG: hypothetical protein ABSC05_38260 [Candidatus Solibacter sp.]|jgi:hypothetical protein